MEHLEVVGQVLGDARREDDLGSFCPRDALALLELLYAEGEEVLFVYFLLAHVRIGAHYAQFSTQIYKNFLE